MLIMVFTVRPCRWLADVRRSIRAENGVRHQFLAKKSQESLILYPGFSARKVANISRKGKDPIFLHGKKSGHKNL